MLSWDKFCCFHCFTYNNLLKTRGELVFSPVRTETQGLSYVAELALNSNIFLFQSLFCTTDALENNTYGRLLI